MRILSKCKRHDDADKIKYNFFVFDTETTCLEPMEKNFVFGCLYGYNTKKTFYSVEDFKTEFGRKCYKGKYIFAHNAEFDLLTIFGNILMKVDTSAIFNGRFISAKYKDVTFADSMSIYPTSVEKIGKLINLEKMDNLKVRSAGLTKGNITPQDVEYCMRDCEIVYRALLRIFEMTGVIRITLPSLAMYDFRSNYLEDNMRFSELVDDFYESYYGGRTEAFRIGKVNAKVYDVNSMYPKAMSTVTLPDVKRLTRCDKVDLKFFDYCINRFEGMAKVTVFHKDSFFGYLPVRMELNHAMKLVFPTGEFTTTVNFNELRYAIQSGVVEVRKVHYIIYGNPIASIFTKYIEDNYERKRTATDKLDALIHKNKMNSLYGRFGMRLKLTTTYYDIIPFNLVSQIRETGRFCDIKLFNAIRADCYLITESEKAKNSFFSIPAIASYITSEARVLLLRALVANERNDVVYCDTDSIFLNGTFTGDVGDELGQFKLEPKRITEINGLKNYKYEDEKGTSNIVIKGISRGCTAKGTTPTGETVFETQRYYKTRASLRNNKIAGKQYTLRKIVTNNYDKRETFPDGTTRTLICRDGKPVNATTFIRRRTTKKIDKRLRMQPNNIREAVLLFFINGGKIYTEDLKSHVTGKSVKEIRKFFGLHSRTGVHMDVFCEHIAEEFYTDRIIDVFQDVLQEFTKKSQMREYMENLYKPTDKPEIKLSEYEYDFDEVPF